jgi:hypothetical protein
MTARLLGGQTCQDGNFSKDGDFAQQGHPPRWATLQLWANLPRTAMWWKRQLMMQCIPMHCKWCHDWAGTIATKGLTPVLQRQQHHCNEVKGMLVAMHMQHGDNTSVTGNDTSEYWWWFQQGLCQGRWCYQHDHSTTKGDLAKDGRLAFSSYSDIITVGNFAKEVDVAMTSTSNLFIASCHQKYCVHALRMALKFEWGLCQMVPDLTRNVAFLNILQNFG